MNAMAITPITYQEAVSIGFEHLCHFPAEYKMDLDSIREYRESTGWETITIEKNYHGEISYILMIRKEI